MNLQAGTPLQGGKYRITRFIGSGGFGCTYEAEHVMLGKRVAIKEFFVHDFCNRDGRTSRVTVGTESKKELVEKLKRKFIDEARALNGLHHPGIVSVADVFEENGTAYYVMDYIEGHSLIEMVEREGKLPEERAVRYVRQVAEALRYVHGHNRLHLDVKPGNIMVNRQDDTVLIDFGASKQYDEVNGENTSTLVGKTPGYAPPEQMGNNVMKFTPTTDIYALGATLYKMLTGRTPLDATLRISGETLDPLPATVSETTRKAVEAAMRLNKRERPQTMDAFIGMLDARGNAPEEEAEATVIEKKPTPTPSSPSRQAAQKPSEKGAKVVGIVVSIVILMILLWSIPWSGSETPIVNETTVITHTPAEQYNKGIEYYNQEDYVEAVEWFKKAAEKKHVEAQFYLGECYDLGQGVTKNKVEAMKWFRKAAEQGHADAQFRMGCFYYGGSYVAEDLAEAEKWFRKAAEQGHASAQRNLGIMYKVGDGVNKDITEAIKWFRKAAEQGDAWAREQVQQLERK